MFCVNVFCVCVCHFFPLRRMFPLSYRVSVNRWCVCACVHVCRPIEALDGKYIARVSCGHNFTVAVSEFGDAFSWGVNGVGQLLQRNYTAYSGVAPCLSLPAGTYVKQVRSYTGLRIASFVHDLFSTGADCIIQPPSCMHNWTAR